jgi:hypothetical protein
MEMYAKGLMNGIYCIDEVRAWEDLEPLPDGLGQTYRVPLNQGEVGDDAPGESPPADGGTDPGEGGNNGDSGAPEPGGNGGDPGE